MTGFRKRLVNDFTGNLKWTTADTILPKPERYFHTLDLPQQEYFDVDSNSYSGGDRLSFLLDGGFIHKAAATTFVRNRNPRGLLKIL